MRRVIFIVMCDRDSLIRAAGRCSAGFQCTGTPASSSALWSAQGSAGSAIRRRERGPRSHTSARCPSTRSDVTILPGRGYHCPAGTKQEDISAVSDCVKQKV